MVLRIVRLGLALAVVLGGPSGTLARPEPDAGARRLTPNGWVAMVVTRITRAGETAPAGTPGGTVTIRVRIGSDGTMEGAVVEESSGLPALDDRALQAAKAASPFAPPPPKLLTLEGFTELSFAVEFAKAADRPGTPQVPMPAGTPRR